MDWAKPRAAIARLGPLDSAAAEVAFFLALSLVPFVAIAIALVSRLLPLDLSASIEKVLRGVLPSESHISADVLNWARSSSSKGWLTAGFVLALWSSFRFMSLCIGALSAIISGDTRPSSWTWRSSAQSVLLLLVWIVALVATALFLLVAPAIERGLIGVPAMTNLTPSSFAALRLLIIAGILFTAIFLTYRMAAGARLGSFALALADRAEFLYHGE